MSGHEHRRDWTQWEYDPDTGNDVREGTCGCSDVTSQSRLHQHRFTDPVPDIFQEFSGKGQLRVCKACMTPDRIPA